MSFDKINIKIEDFLIQKKDLDKDLLFIIDTVYKNSKITLNKNNLYFKNNVFKVKVSSNFKFLIYLNLDKINKDIKSYNERLSLEL